MAAGPEWPKAPRIESSIMPFARAILLSLLAAAGTAKPAAPAIVVSDVWSRPAADTAVIYATIANRGTAPDRLDGASSPVAKGARLHDNIQRGLREPGSVGGMTMPMGEVMSMKPVSSIPVPALGTTTLAPGGYHIMLDLLRGIRRGETIPLRLHFARAGWISTSSHVR
jgi:copper(I)-binding protein